MLQGLTDDETTVGAVPLGLNIYAPDAWYEPLIIYITTVKYIFARVPINSESVLFLSKPVNLWYLLRWIYRKESFVESVNPPENFVKNLIYNQYLLTYMQVRALVTLYTSLISKKSSWILNNVEYFLRESNHIIHESATAHELASSIS
jgi:hypothetical protein